MIRRATPASASAPRSSGASESERAVPSLRGTSLGLRPLDTRGSRARFSPRPQRGASSEAASSWLLGSYRAAAGSPVQLALPGAVASREGVT